MQEQKKKLILVFKRLHKKGGGCQFVCIFLSQFIIIVPAYLRSTSGHRSPLRVKVLDRSTHAEIVQVENLASLVCASLGTSRFTPKLK